jgi:hypothetical protein
MTAVLTAAPPAQGNVIAPPPTVTVIQGAPGAAQGASALPAPATAAQTSATPQAVYQALVAQRRELYEQLETVESRRLAIAQRLREGNSAEGADRKGLEERATVLDKQMVSLYSQIAVADAAVAQAAAVPGATVRPPSPPRNGPPEEVFVLGGLFIFAVMMPIAIAYSRRIWRRSAAIVANLPKDMAERLNRIEESVDSVAIEVERIGEGQRFVTNLFIESGAPQMLGSGGMETLEIRAREKAEQARRE